MLAAVAGQVRMRLSRKGMSILGILAGVVIALGLNIPKEHTAEREFLKM